MMRQSASKTAAGHRPSHGRLGWIVALLLAGLLPITVAQEQTLVESGSSILYLANDVDPGATIEATWMTPGFDDSGWDPGTYGVGYDSSGSASNLIETIASSAAHSIYTRTTFSLSDPVAVFSVFLGADYDDGLVAWINGVEVYRSPEMRTRETTYYTISGDHESSNGVVPDYQPMRNITAAALPHLVPGDNVLAVGIWNSSHGSSDCVLVPRLAVNRILTRAPYLQIGTESSVLIRWQTGTPTSSTVLCGPNPAELQPCAEDSPLVTGHEVQLSGLTPNTRYYYAVGHGSGTSFQPLAGGDAGHYFDTAPESGTAKPTRIWILGDSGTGDNTAGRVRDAYLDYTAGDHTELWLMLGDNAYPLGTDVEYQENLFDIYREMLARSVLWPTPGNHDGIDHSEGSWPYYDNFSLPTQAEAGGLVSGSEAYYAFDFANIHFVVLDSNDTDRTPGSPMLTWLALDLAATDQDWVIAYFHHPPYSKGSHNSDNPEDSAGRLFDMRENVVPILDDYGVDLVLSGHSHTYERSYLIDGHYDVSSTFVESMKVDLGDGDPDGDGAYIKPYRGTVPYTGSGDGAVYTVAGSSGKLTTGTAAVFGGTEPTHPVHLSSLFVHGSVALEIDGNRLDARFLDATGAVQDRYTIFKGGVTVPPGADFAATPLVAAPGVPIGFVDLTTNQPTSWGWDFDDDGAVDSNRPAPSNSYAQTGIYTVSLAVSNSAGADQHVKSGYICITGGVPLEITNLLLHADGTIAWEIEPNATSYAVVKGDLVQLQAGAGLAGSQLSCFESGMQAQTLDTQSPGAGEGFYYVARGDNCVPQRGTFDTTGPGQISSRDAALQGPGAVCP